MYQDIDQMYQVIHDMISDNDGEIRFGADSQCPSPRWNSYTRKVYDHFLAFGVQRQPTVETLTLDIREFILKLQKEDADYYWHLVEAFVQCGLYDDPTGEFTLVDE